MKLRVHIITLLTLFVLPVGLVAHPALAETWPDQEHRFLELVNQARANPMEAAAALGLDVSSLMQARPELRLLLAQPMPPLAEEERLHATASAHAQDMAEKGYFSRTSPDGLPPSDRMKQAGYHPVVAAEGLGFLSFRNFVPPAEAVDKMFSNMLKMELTKTAPEQWAILNPQARDGSCALTSTRFDLGGENENVYLLVFDAGTSIEFAFESSVLHTLNELRSSPRGVLADLYPDGALPPPFGRLSAFPDLRLPPLARISDLDASATQRGKIILLDSQALSTGFTATSDVYSALDELGYHAAEVAEVTIFFPLEPTMGFEAIVQRAMTELVLAEANRPPDQAPALFSRDFSEIGLGTHVIAREDGSFWLLLVLHFARPQDARTHLVGRVLQESGDGDAFASSPQEFLLAVLTRDDGSVADSAVLDASGDFQLHIPQDSLPLYHGDLIIVGLDGLEKYRKSVYVAGANHWMSLILTD